MTETMPAYVSDALALAQRVDPEAESMGEDERYCILVLDTYAHDVSLILGELFDYEDPTHEAAKSGFARIIVKDRC